MDFFPYSLRQNQKAIISTIQNTIRNQNHFILESGTGSGKTICSLSATLPYAFEQDKKIVYITRTNSQQRQVIIELRHIHNHAHSSKIHNTILGVGIQGRTNMCPQVIDDKELLEGTSEELSKYCANEKKKARTSKKGCRYYRNFVEKKDLIKKTSEWVKTQMPTTEEFIEYCIKKHICPYELNKTLVREARVVVIPYIYIFNVTIRNMLFDWLGVSEEDIILIVDEAHNLPDYIRDLFSTQISSWMCKNCVNEAKNYGNPSLGSEQIPCSSFCSTLESIIKELRDSYVYNIFEEGIRKQQTSQQSDAFLPKNEFIHEIYQRMKLDEKKMYDIIEDLVAYGEKIQEDKQKKNKLPRSYLHKLGLFLEFWMNLADNQYAKLIVDAADGKNPRIEAYCLDPSLGANILHKFHSTVHMSGTLEPLEEYRDSMGLPLHTILTAYPSPFPREHRKLLYVTDVTTKYTELMKDDTIQKKMWEYISTVCNKFPQNTIIFFPSYSTLSLFQRNYDFSEINKSVFLEERQMSQSALMDLVSDFKSQADNLGIGGTLFSVIGGRISEGMDFPSKQLEIVLIVGIPYPKPTARQRGLQRYYEMKFRKGWEYTVQAPTARKLLQAIGRLIRDEQDKGVALILDRRASRFKQYIRELKKSSNIMHDIEELIG